MLEWIENLILSPVMVRRRHKSPGIHYKIPNGAAQFNTQWPESWPRSIAGEFLDRYFPLDIHSVRTWSSLFGLPLVLQRRDPSSVPTAAHTMQDTFSQAPAAPMLLRTQEGTPHQQPRSLVTSYSQTTVIQGVVSFVSAWFYWLGK